MQHLRIAERGAFVKMMNAEFSMAVLEISYKRRKLRTEN